MKTVIKIIALILVLVLSAGLITVAVKTDFFRNFEGLEFPGSSSETGSYLEVSGERYSEGSILPAESNLRIDVRGMTDYTVNIVTTDDTFDYSVDGVLYKFPYNLDVDWNEVFELELGDGYFTFNNKYQSIESVLENYVHVGSDVTDCKFNSKNDTFFKIQVVSDNVIVEIPISGVYSHVDLSLNYDSIVF